MSGDQLLELPEKRKAAIDTLIRAGFLQRCPDHDHVIDCQIGDDEAAYSKAKARGLTREDVERLVGEHGTRCPGCDGRERR